MYIMKGHVTHEDIGYGIESGDHLSQLEKAAHVSMVLEGTIIPALNQNNQLTLKLKGNN